MGHCIQILSNFNLDEAAIRAVLECGEFKRVFMPSYICESINNSAVDAGVEIDTYDLDGSLYPKDLPGEMPEDSALIYVNYFGLCQRNVLRLVEEFPHDQLIVDSSHALFAPHGDVLATVYSPRKFAGLPDGGLLNASPGLKIRPPTEEDRGSFERMKYLLTRMAYSAREGYAEFEAARNSLAGTYPLAMSKLTQRLMRAIDWAEVRELRRENYGLMAEMLDSMNSMHWALGEADVPLCYPLTLPEREAGQVRG